MSALTDDLQDQLEKLFVQEKILTPERIAEAKVLAKSKGAPLLTQLVQDKAISNEELTRGIASVSKIPSLLSSSRKSRMA